MASHGARVGCSGERDRICQDADSLDLDFHPITRFEVAGAIASLEFAPARDRAAPPHFAGLDRLDAGEALDHLGEGPEGSLAGGDPGVLEYHGPIPVSQPLLVVHSDDHGLVSQLAELVA